MQYEQTNIKSQGSPYDHVMLCLPQTISNILFATLNQVLLLIILQSMNIYYLHFLDLTSRLFKMSVVTYRVMEVFSQRFLLMIIFTYMIIQCIKAVQQFGNQGDLIFIKELRIVKGCCQLIFAIKLKLNSGYVGLQKGQLIKSNI